MRALTAWMGAGLLTLIPGWVQAAEFRIGMSTTFVGDAGFLGTQARLGVEAAFAEINQSGLLPAGRTLQLRVREDGYEPEGAVQSVRELIEQDQVIALLANLDALTSVVTEPLARKLKTPFVAPLTGAIQLRHDPPERYVYHLRPSYEDEIDLLVQWALRQGILPEQIAVFTQRDAFGDDIYRSTLTVLHRHGLTARGRIPHVRYIRDTLHVELAVADLIGQMNPPRAIIIGGAARPSAKFIRLIQSDLPDMLFLAVSFTASEHFAESLHDLPAEIMATQVVPSPTADYPVLGRFRAALDKHAEDARPTHAALEGYLAAHLLAQALARTRPPHDREALADALMTDEIMEVCPGVTVGLGAGRRAGGGLWLTRVQLGQLLPLALEPRLGTTCTPSTDAPP